MSGIMRRSLLRPGGRLFVVGSRREPTASTPDQPLPEVGGKTMRRRLNDGRGSTPGNRGQAT